ncbi:MAG: hypothetical protein P4N60_17035 [Verrucomicrobiae bacterium]|nr:hypothetical protein [Verrucomicrobiae bacterium]
MNFYLWFRAGWVLSLLFIAVSLSFYGAKEVRGDVGEVGFLTFIGAVWMFFANTCMAWLGINWQDDVLERKNPAALATLTGGSAAVAIMYAGGNLGEGPSYWENIFSAALATGSWFGLWLILELGGRICFSIAEERDFASGLRFGGWLLACGLILGRAVAGDWHSITATLSDFGHDGWMAAVLLLVALLMEPLLRPSRQRPFPRWVSCGLAPALFHLAIAGIWLWHLGRWEGMPI